LVDWNTLRYNVIREFDELARKNDPTVPVSATDYVDECLLSMSGRGLWRPPKGIRPSAPVLP